MIDTATSAVETTEPVRANPDLTTDSSGTAYITNGEGSSVSVLTTATDRCTGIACIPLDPSAVGRSSSAPSGSRGRTYCVIRLRHNSIRAEPGSLGDQTIG